MLQKIDDNFMKRDIVKIYHPHGTEVFNENQNIKFFLAETLNYIQKVKLIPKLIRRLKKLIIQLLLKLTILD